MTPTDARLADGEVDRIREVELSSILVPLRAQVSDAKVLTGVQRPMTHVPVLVARVRTEHGNEGLGFSYATRGGGPAQLAHAVEVAPVILGEDPSDIQRLWTRMAWAGASVGRSGASTQAIGAIDVALWDVKARRAGLSLARLLGAQHDALPVYNTSGGYFDTATPDVLDRADASLARGIRGVKLKVGSPDPSRDLARVTAVREHLGDRVPIMVDANQQWDRMQATRMIRDLEPLGLTWVEEPLDAYDVVGHAALARRFDTPIATGEMLTSVAELRPYVDAGIDVLQPDVPRVGGVTPFLDVLTLARLAGIDVAPHFVMEIHVHVAATCERAPWIEHFEWFEPLFHERVEIADGTMRVPTRPGLGLTLTEQASAWTTATHLVR